jgi:DNA-directed RNA polymerase subunit RPC12/RpoP
MRTMNEREKALLPDQAGAEPPADGLNPSSPQWRVLTMRRLRRERGWSMGQVAKKVGLNVSQVSRAESGLRRPWTIPVICGVFEVTEAEAMIACPHCGYRPPSGYACLRCGTEGREDDTGSGRKCGTIGCNRTATHTLAYSFPESRETTETDLVCQPCGEGYLRRPTLKASLAEGIGHRYVSGN